MGGVFKPADTTATETSHAIHDAEFERMEAHLIKQHKDLKNLRKFVVGYVMARHKAEQAEIEAAAAATPRRRGRAAPPRRKLRPPPSLPKMSDAPKAVQHRDFDEVLDMAPEQMQQMIQDFEAEEAAAEEAAEAEFEYPELPDLPDGPEPPF